MKKLASLLTDERLTDLCPPMNFSNSHLPHSPFMQSVQSFICISSFYATFKSVSFYQNRPKIKLSLYKNYVNFKYWELHNQTPETSPLRCKFLATRLIRHKSHPYRLIYKSFSFVSTFSRFCFFIVCALLLMLAETDM